MISYGHQKGDACLQMTGRILSEFAHRFGDLAARYSGAQFVLILHNTGKDGALVIAERICEAVKGMKAEDQAIRSARWRSASVLLKRI